MDDHLLLKASVAYAVLMAGAVWMPDVAPPRQAPATVANSESIDVALRDYESARQSGNVLDRCTRAHAVALAYLRAEDRAGYQTWESLGSSDCAAAGFHSDSETASLPVPQGLSSTSARLPIVAPRGGGT